jgi:peroxiredoxin
MKPGVSNMRPGITPLLFTGSVARAALCLAGTLLWSQNPRAGGSGGPEADAAHPVMKIGTHIPDFTLPGAGGKPHSLKEWANAKYLLLVFECNHCPESQNYESRIGQLYKDYKGKGVQLVAINPNDPASVRLSELGYTDVEDSLPEMKIRKADRHITWPYLYDGETQNVATKLGVIATPQVFIFDQDRNLRFEGQIDNNQSPGLVTSNDTRYALEELLAGKQVTTTDTPVHGCSTKWKSRLLGSDSREAEMTNIHAEPVTLETVDEAGLKELKANNTGKVLVVTFWSAKCTTCADSLHALETTWRMYRLRAFTLVTVNTDPIASKDAVMGVLNDQHASTSNGTRTPGNSPEFTSWNLQSTLDRATTQAAFGERWNPDSMFTAVIGSGGKVLYKKMGLIVKDGSFPNSLADATPSPDLLTMRRTILANMPDTVDYPGNRAYWQEDYVKIVAKSRTDWMGPPIPQPGVMGNTH